MTMLDERIEDVMLPEGLTEEECYLAAILMDRSGVDLAEFLFPNHTAPDGCFRLYPYQFDWWRSEHDMSVEQSARDTGKSEGVCARACALPFNFPGEEHALVAPEGTHLDRLTERIEARIKSVRLLLEMVTRGANGITHRPFHIEWRNGARTYALLPQRSGIGVKGCVDGEALILTARGFIPAKEVCEGDQVWSHLNRWSDVAMVESFVDDAYEMKGQGSFPIVVSSAHRVFGRFDTSRTPGKTKVELGPHGWAHVSSLERDRSAFYWSSTTDFSNVDLPVPPIDYEQQQSVRIPTETSDFWWVVGRFLADGYTTSAKQTLRRSRETIRTSYRVKIVCTPGQNPPVVSRLRGLGFSPGLRPRDHSSADIVEVCSTPFGRWLDTHFGKLADGKSIPAWVLGMPDAHRAALLDGYQSGDANLKQRVRGVRSSSGSASKQLSLGIGLLGQSLGLCAGYSLQKVSVTEINGVPLKNEAKPSWRVRLSENGKGHFDDDGYVSYKVRTIASVGAQTVWNIVSADRSFCADGILHHNCHAVWLDVDEAQDVPEPAWREMPMTVRREIDGSRWTAHGVSKGVRTDTFFKITQPGSGWFVHRYTQLHKPTYNKANRPQLVKDHGGSDTSGDFLRNVYGEHGDTQNRIFVLTHFRAAVDDRAEGSDVNDEYYQPTITGDEIAAMVGSKTAVDVSSEDATNAIQELLEFPITHRNKYKTFWAGMDVGLVGDPSEIVVLAECVPAKRERDLHKVLEIATPDEGISRFRLVTRIRVSQLPEPLQADLIMWLINFYEPKAFALDAGGNGLPVYQELMKRAGRSQIAMITPPDIADNASEEQRKTFAKEMVEFEERKRKASEALTVIKGYKFGQKLLVDFHPDEVAKLGANPDLKDMIEKAGMYQEAKTRGTDVLRTMVDNRRFLFPNDSEFFDQMNGQTFVYSAEPVDAYGKRRAIFSSGTFHILDAMRFFALGYSQDQIEKIVAAGNKPKKPVLDRFVSY
jgi:hypothetical protein